MVNWRRLPSDIPYPHYESIREFLVEDGGSRIVANLDTPG